MTGVLPLIERKIELLPVNPGLRAQVLAISIVLSALGGFGGYRSFRQTRRGVLFGFLGVAFVLISFICGIALIDGISFGLSPLYVSLAVRAAYLVMFLSLGFSIGAFLSI